MKNFPRQLRQLGTARRIRQTRVAELLAVRPRVSTLWEDGDADPLFATVATMADILNVTLEDQKALVIAPDSRVKRSTASREKAEL